jgi:predicted dehydrogenase
MIILSQIGIGAWGKNHLRNYAKLGDCKVKYACDKNKALLEGLERDYKGEIAVTEDPEDIFRDPEIDAVVIATLPDTHAKLAIRAIESGKHVFIEKPLAMSVKEGLEIKKAVLKYKKICMVGHILLYHPAVLALKKYINEGYLGDICYIYTTRVNLGQVRKEENALWSLTSHDISVIMHLLGKSPVSISATGEAYLRKNIHDVVFLSLNFKGNSMAHVHASWLDPHKIRQLTVVGSKRMAVFDDMSSAEKLKIYDKGVDKVVDKNSYEAFLTIRSGDILVPTINMDEPLKLECQEFLNCIKHNRQPLADVDNGIEVLKVLEAAQKSLDSGGAKVGLNL